MTVPLDGLQAPENEPVLPCEKLPEPFVVGDAGRAYLEIVGGAPFSTAMPSDAVCDGFDFEGWALRAASVRGLSHRHAGTARQDAYAVRYAAETDRLVLIVCDGVGSGVSSHIAADVASTFLADELIDCDLGDDPNLWTGIFADASAAVCVRARQVLGRSDAEIDDVRAVMATTAVAVVVSAVTQPGPWEVCYAAVGDSSLWTARHHASDEAFEGWTPILGGKINDGEFASNRTSALPLWVDSPVRSEHFELDGEMLLLLCTDGVGDAFLGGAGPVAIELGSAWSSPPTPLNFAAHVSFGRRSLLDDRTGIALWSPGG